MIICLQYVAIPSIYNLELNIAAKKTMNCMLELLNSSHMYYIMTCSISFLRFSK
jgi:hypothetical protein